MTTTNNQKYAAEVFWSDDDEGFIAVAHDLPGCSAWGENQGEAIAELSQAIEAWIKAATAAGNPIPEPSKPASAEQYSGKFLLRMPRSLHADLDRQAKADGTSLNSYVVYLLTQRHTQLRTIELMDFGFQRFMSQIASARTSPGSLLHSESEFLSTTKDFVMAPKYDSVHTVSASWPASDLPASDLVVH